MKLILEELYSAKDSGHMKGADLQLQFGNLSSTMWMKASCQTLQIPHYMKLSVWICSMASE